TAWPPSQATKGKMDGDKAVKSLLGWKFDSPRGPIMIDPETRDIVMNEYLAEVVKGLDGKLHQKVIGKIDKCEIERQRKQYCDKKLGPEAQIIGKRKIEADGGEPRQQLPPAETMTRDQDVGRHLIDTCGNGCGTRGDVHVVFLPNRP